MTTIHDLLEELEDTHEFVLRVVAADPLVAIWKGAAEEARAAYARWLMGTGSHAGYLAAEDQADAAFASLRRDRDLVAPTHLPVPLAA